MIGFLVLFVAIIWFIAAAFLAQFITRKLPWNWWGMPARVLLFIALLMLPLIDEIVGKWQFEQLCKSHGEIIVDATNTKGRTIWFGESQRTQISLNMIQGTLAKRSFVDAKTHEPIYHYYRLEARSGWFIRAIGFTGEKPLLFNGFCQPKNIETIDTQLGLTRINRPTSN
jgi:hypothetical protein